MPDSKSKRASSISASLASVSPALECVADLALCPPPRLVLLRPLEELLERPLELDLDIDLDGELLWDLDRDTDWDLLLSLRPEHDLDTERDLDLLRSSSSLSAIDCLID